MSQIFSLEDRSYSLLAEMLNERNGVLPELIVRVKWTTNERWEFNLPLTYGNVKVGQDKFVKHWAVEPGVDKTVHIKLRGSAKYSEQTHGIIVGYRPSAILLARELHVLTNLIKTSNFKIDIRNDQGELIETGNFTPADCLAVRCSI